MIVSMLVKAQEEVAAGQKREVEEEDPYNQENLEQVSSPAEPGPCGSGPAAPSQKLRPQ